MENGNIAVSFVFGYTIDKDKQIFQRDSSWQNEKIDE